MKRNEAGERWEAGTGGIASIKRIRPRARRETFFRFCALLWAGLRLAKPGSSLFGLLPKSIFFVR